MLSVHARYHSLSHHIKAATDASPAGGCQPCCPPCLHNRQAPPELQLQVQDLSNSLAFQLHTEFGVRRGDRVAIAMRNLPEWVLAYVRNQLVAVCIRLTSEAQIAVTSMGAIAVPLNGWWTGKELEYGLQVRSRS